MEQFCVFLTNRMHRQKSALSECVSEFFQTPAVFSQF